MSESIRRATHVGKRRTDLALEPLGADAAVVQGRCTAARASRRARALGIAGVADQDMTAFMVCRRHVARVALDHMPAPRAEDERVKPAPVQEQDDLPPVVECLDHGLAERLAQAAHDGLLVPHVDDLDGRHGPAADPARHRQPRVPAALGVAPAFERRRGRAQQHRNPFHLRSLDGHVARVYRGVVSCLKLLSCSSSMTISPSRRAGAKTADRAPTTTWTSPEAMLCQWRCRSASLMWLCRRRPGQTAGGTGGSSAASG